MNLEEFGEIMKLGEAGGSRPGGTNGGQISSVTFKHLSKKPLKLCLVTEQDEVVPNVGISNAFFCAWCPQPPANTALVPSLGKPKNEHQHSKKT